MSYDGVPVAGSPFLVEALTPANPRNVKAFGPGLKSGKVDEIATFTIDTNDAGDWFVGISVELS